MYDMRGVDNMTWAMHIKGSMRFNDLKMNEQTYQSTDIWFGVLKRHWFREPWPDTENITV